MKATSVASCLKFEEEAHDVVPGEVPVCRHTVGSLRIGWNLRPGVDHTWGWSTRQPGGGMGLLSVGT
jgi:hypothetical protein